MKPNSKHEQSAPAGPHAIAHALAAIDQWLKAHDRFTAARHSPLTADNVANVSEMLRAIRAALGAIVGEPISVTVPRWEEERRQDADQEG
jgi:hypothetical protein